MTKHKIAVIAGDGIGKEVVPEGIRVLEAAGRKFGFAFQWDELPWSCDYYVKHGRMMPEDGLEQIRQHDAIFLGAVGFPALVPDHVSLWGLLIKLRRELRAVRQHPPGAADARASGRRWPTASRATSTSSSCARTTRASIPRSAAAASRAPTRRWCMQTSVFTRRGVDRIMRYAFELAGTRPAQHVTSATKSNGMFIAMPYWDERFKAMAAHYPDIRTDQYHIDILTAHFVQHPDWFDVVVGSNLFGDILSDLGPACTGTIGIAPSANLNPEREYPSMFEPVHGSAPDIAGRNIANPIGQIWSGAMMLEHLGHKEAAAAVVRAIETVLAEGPRTRDIGGQASTQRSARRSPRPCDRGDSPAPELDEPAPVQRLSQGDDRRTSTNHLSRRPKSHAQTYHRCGHADTACRQRRRAGRLSVRTITMIVPFAAGGPTDTVGRLSPSR